MRILLVHSHYRSSLPSGENVVFALERDLLRRAGHEVRTFERHSDALLAQGALGALRGAASTPWNPFAARALLREVEAFRPEVVHVHNTFPRISPAIFPALAGRAARVLTLHNYRLFCAAGFPARGGRPCTECLDRRSAWPALRHGCYRGSRLATAPLALGVGLARRREVWTRHVEAFVALTAFQRDLLVAAGLPADKVAVKPNFYPGRPEPIPWARRRDAVVFAGRLSEEKGVAHLLEAWIAWGPGAPPLRLAGDGPLRAPLEARARAAGLGPERIAFLGQLGPEAAVAEIAAARLLVVPSTWFEGFPLVLREALAFGTPAAVSEIGALPALVEDGRAGWTFRPGDAAALLAAVQGAWASPALLERKGAAARAAFEARYQEAENLAALEAIYRAAVARREGRAA